MYDDSGSHQIDVDISTWKPIGEGSIMNEMLPLCGWNM
jgi:hypothetical protein